MQVDEVNVHGKSLTNYALVATGVKTQLAAPTTGLLVVSSYSRREVTRCEKLIKTFALQPYLITRAAAPTAHTGAGRMKQLFVKKLMER